MSFDLATFYAHIPEKLVETQTKLENAIQSFGEASEANTEATVNYRKAKSECIKKYRAENMAVSIISDIVRGETADLKGKMLSTETEKKKCLMVYDALRERLFTLRNMNKSTEQLVR